MKSTPSLKLCPERQSLPRKAEEGNFTKSIGSTYAPHSTLLIVTSDDNCSDNPLEEPEKSEEDQWDDMEGVIASGMACIWSEPKAPAYDLEEYEWCYCKTSHSLRAKWRSKREKCLMN
jgi:hypothetical protein